MSAKVFRVSTKILAGIAILPLWSTLSGLSVTLMVVSKSDAVIINASSCKSKRKSSKIGSVLLLLITPIMDCRFLSNRELETMNFIFVCFLARYWIFYVHTL